MGLQRVTSPLSEREERIAAAIVSSAFAVHKELGPGLLESVYEACFCHTLTKQGFHCVRQVVVPVTYDGVAFDEGFRIDVLVESLVICELKAVEVILPVHEAQLLTYLKLSHKRLGFLINFNVPLIKHGIKRFVL
ncbi:MAG: GxxExxY protein [Candidatus Brachytrichaceae bacterium NZ_4S206]|jgi:GxxExxY protein